MSVLGWWIEKDSHPYPSKQDLSGQSQDRVLTTIWSWLCGHSDRNKIHVQNIHSDYIFPSPGDSLIADYWSPVSCWTPQIPLAQHFSFTDSVTVLGISLILTSLVFWHGSSTVVWEKCCIMPWLSSETLVKVISSDSIVDHLARLSGNDHGVAPHYREKDGWRGPEETTF